MNVNYAASLWNAMHDKPVMGVIEDSDSGELRPARVPDIAAGQDGSICRNCTRKGCTQRLRSEARVVYRP